MKISWKNMIPKLALKMTQVLVPIHLIGWVGVDSHARAILANKASGKLANKASGKLVFLAYERIQPKCLKMIYFTSTRATTLHVFDVQTTKQTFR